VIQEWDDVFPTAGATDILEFVTSGKHFRADVDMDNQASLERFYSISEPLAVEVRCLLRKLSFRPSDTRAHDTDQSKASFFVNALAA
jgi:hypothetical protein